VSKHGKGSHGRLFYGGKFTTIKDRTKEIKSGLLSAILKQLGINRQDIE
jgi:predicted RNA binding protein YcfA (HicA-like mRNA interferase family)